jgi:acid stress-induced BolA-like protein IbaG/YrbA
VALRILSSPSAPQDLAREMERAIVAALPGASAEVQPAGPGHYEIRVVSAAFAGQTRVRQQQLVYAAIAKWLQGDSAPVHAIDRLVTETP